MELKLTGKRVLVTGASIGLGLHFAQILARSGAEATLAARRFSKVQEVAEEIRADGYGAEALELDATNNIALKKAFSANSYDA